jgi:hypothetical protein
LQPLHAPFVQLWPAGQGWQSPPPAPHDGAVSPGRHTPFAQQPLGQEVPSQTQVLPMHRCPSAHATSLPQRHAPADEQLSARASQATQVEPPSPQVARERVSHVVP